MNKKENNLEVVYSITLYTEAKSNCSKMILERGQKLINLNKFKKWDGSGTIMTKIRLIPSNKEGYIVNSFIYTYIKKS